MIDATFSSDDMQYHDTTPQSSSVETDDAIRTSSYHHAQRGDALDIPELDTALLSLFLPRLKIMFKYIHMDIITGLFSSASWATNNTDDGGVPNIMSSTMIDSDRLDQIKRNIFLSLLKGCTILSTLLWSARNDEDNGTKVVSTLGTPAMTALQTILCTSQNHHNKDNETRMMKERGNTVSTSNNNASRKQVWKFFFLSVVLPLLYELVEWLRHNQYHADDDDEEYDNNLMVNDPQQNLHNNNSSLQEQRRIQQLRRQQRRIIARQRQKRILNYIHQFVSRIVRPLQLYHHISYILQSNSQSQGIRRKSPTLALHWSGLDYCYHSPPPNNNNDAKKDGASSLSPSQQQTKSVNFTYAHRRVLFEETMLLASMLVPLSSWRSISNDLSRRWNSRRSSSRNRSWRDTVIARINYLRRRIRPLEHASEPQEDQTTPDTSLSCPICSLNPICIPYITSCGHVYCYTCLRQAAMDHEHYKCLVCGSEVKFSKRFPSFT